MEHAVKSQGSPERLDYIDALRGIAISGVVLIHSGQIVPGLPKWLSSLADYGGNGVELFFLLSALTLASVYSGRTLIFREFLCRRFFRIAPMFYLGIAFYAWFRIAHEQFFAPSGIHARQLLLTGFFLHGWFPDSFNAVVPGGWSIADEAMFYLAFPLLLRLINTPWRAVFAFLGAALLMRATIVLMGRFIGREDLMITFAHFSFPAQLIFFVSGFVVFQLDRAIPATIRSRKIWANVGLAMTMAALLGAGCSGSIILKHAVVTAVLFIAFVLTTRLSASPAIVNTLLIRLGRISYSIYLVHFAVVDVVGRYLLLGLQSMPPALQLAVVFSVSLFASALVSALTYRAIEQPAIAFGRRLIRRSVPEKAA